MGRAQVVQLASLQAQLQTELQGRGVRVDLHRGLGSGGAPEAGTDVAPLSFADFTGRLVEVTGPLSDARQAISARTSWTAARVAEAQAAGEIVAWLQLADGPLYPPDLAALGVDVGALVVVLLPDAAAQWKAADVLLRSGGFGLVVVDLATLPLPTLPLPTLPLPTRGGPAAQRPPLPRSGRGGPCEARGGEGAPAQPTQAQLGRLLGLCQKHGAALVVLTSPHGAVGADSPPVQGTAPRPSPGSPREAASPPGDLGSLVSLRVEVGRAPTWRMEAQERKTGRPTGTRVLQPLLDPSGSEGGAGREGHFQLKARAVKDKRRGPGTNLQEAWRGPEGVWRGSEGPSPPSSRSLREGPSPTSREKGLKS